VLLGGAVLAAAAAAADRLLARIAGRRVSRHLAALLSADPAPAVRIASAPFLPQLVAGLYREIEVTLAAVTVGGLDFHKLTARLTAVRAPFRQLVAGSGVIAGRVTATATIPLTALGPRLPPGLTLRHQDGELRISGWLALIRVSGTLAVRGSEQRILVTPKVAGVPSLVGFALDVPGMPAELAIEAVLVTDHGLELTIGGSDVRFARSQ
jgi:hypothetical protein